MHFSIFLCLGKKFQIPDILTMKNKSMKLLQESSGTHTEELLSGKVIGHKKYKSMRSKYLFLKSIQRNLAIQLRIEKGNKQNEKIGKRLGKGVCSVYQTQVNIQNI